MDYKKIILALPNSASESFKLCINKSSNYQCDQLFTIQPDYLTNIKRSLEKISFLQKIKYLVSLVHNKTIYPRNNFHPFRIYYPALEYSHISNFHGDIANIDRHLYEKLILHLKNKKNYILKQHFPPTLNNRIFFEDFKKVILIRDPVEVVNKYKNNILLQNNDFRNFIISELESWIEGWSNENNTLIIQKNELVSNTKNTLEQIGEYLDISFNIKNDYKLPFINKTDS